jgi:hypothetical protein
VETLLREQSLLKEDHRQFMNSIAHAKDTLSHMRLILAEEHAWRELAAWFCVLAVAALPLLAVAAEGGRVCAGMAAAATSHREALLRWSMRYLERNLCTRAPV